MGRGVVVGSDDRSVWVGQQQRGRGLLLVLAASEYPPDSLAAALAPAAMRCQLRLLVTNVGSATSEVLTRIATDLQLLQSRLGWSAEPLLLFGIGDGARVAQRFIGADLATVVAAAFAGELAGVWPQAAHGQRGLGRLGIAGEQRAFSSSAGERLLRTPSLLLLNGESDAGAQAWYRRFMAVARQREIVPVVEQQVVSPLLSGGSMSETLGEELLQFFRRHLSTEALSPVSPQLHGRSVRFMT